MSLNHGIAPGFSVRNWAAWAPGLDNRQAWLDWRSNPYLPAGDESPSATFMPPLLRRRALRLGRMAIESLATIAMEAPADTPVVFASRHGETHRSIKLTQELIAEGGVSPQSFSLSVHNATVGLYTITRACRANVTALAGCQATATTLLTEALGLLADGAPSVLVVACDEMLPDCYKPYADEPQAPFAWTAELIAGNEFTPDTTALATASSTLPDLLALLRFLIDPQQTAWTDKFGAINWIRQAAA